MNAVVFTLFVLFSTTLAITGKKCIQQKQTEQKNLQIVLTFLEEAFGQHDLTAVDKYISPDYIEHFPVSVGDGPQALKDFLVKFNANKPKGHLDIRHTAVTRDMVWVHLKMNGTEGKPVAIADIFRVKNWKIVEHWDVIQEIPSPAETRNPHPMF